MRFATRALGIPEKAALASWIKTRSTHEKEVQQAAAVSGTKGNKKAMKKLSVNAERVSPPWRPDPEGPAQPCSGLVNKLFESNITSLYHQHMASPAIKCDDRVYPETTSEGS